jgi:hypothetical protein
LVLEKQSGEKQRGENLRGENLRGENLRGDTYLSRYHVQDLVVNGVHIDVIGGEDGPAIDVSWLIEVGLDVVKNSADQTVDGAVWSQHAGWYREHAVVGSSRRSADTAIPDLKKCFSKGGISELVLSCRCILILTPKLQTIAHWIDGREMWSGKSNARVGS